MPRPSIPVVIDGKKYPSIADAARARGLSNKEEQALRRRVKAEGPRIKSR